jgi:hypothetical protein
MLAMLMSFEQSFKNSRAKTPSWSQMETHNEIEMAGFRSSMHAVVLFMPFASMYVKIEGYFWGKSCMHVSIKSDRSIDVFFESLYIVIERYIRIRICL